ncbi:MAG: hypothetical protein HC895_06495 [Leptolyngbyaceae cyanobacterium SM1_3_5]|nr:hypothetical protein [Leptolyngbyaceae cyanobacterium SM1_3_5]
MKNSIFWSVALRNSKLVCETVVALLQQIDRNCTVCCPHHFATPLGSLGGWATATQFANLRQLNSPPNHGLNAFNC